MSVLVTGGAGYIGSHAVRQLIRHGRRVVVVDNLSKGHRVAVDRAAVFYEVDVADADRLEHIFRQHSVEAVVHFSAFSLVG